MVAMAQKLGQVEPQHVRLANENAMMQRTIAKLKRERDQSHGMVNGLISKLDGAEDSLN